MRGDATLTARLLLRGTGLAALTAGVGGVCALIGSLRPWYVAVARVEMLGADQTRPVASIAGLPGVPWAWLVAVAALVATVVGVAVAVDRPVPRSRLLLAGAAAALLVGAVAGLVTSPDVAMIVGDDAHGLSALSREMPAGVELDLWATSGGGLRLALAAAAVVGVGAAAAREA